VEEAVTAELNALARVARKAKLAGKTLSITKSKAPNNVEGSVDVVAQFIKKWESKFEKWNQVFEDIQDSRLTKQGSEKKKKEPEEFSRGREGQTSPDCYCGGRKGA
jgi:hypothetical protein